MRRSPSVVTLALLALLAAGSARAQPAPAPAMPAPTVPMEACVLILTAFGPVPSCVVTNVDPVAADRSVADYLTNGAGVLAMPSSGPNAEYYHDGAQALAARTTSWVPTFFSPAGPPFEGPPPAPAGSAPAPEAQSAAPPAPPPPAPEGPRPAASSAVDQTPDEPPAPPAPPATTATAAATTPASTPTSAPVVLAIPVPVPVRPWDPAEASESDPMKTTDAAPPGRREPHWELVGAGTVILAGVVYLVTSFIARRRMRPLA